MNAFRAYLVVVVIALGVYTLLVGFQHGWSLFSIFFADIGAMAWPGQFNSDFMTFLSLSGLWLAWRNGFTPGAIALGVLGFFGGMMVLAPYLLYLSIQTKGDMAALLLGERRAGGNRG